MSDGKLRALERKFRKEPEKVREEYAFELWRIGQEHTATRLFMKENFLGIPEVERFFGSLVPVPRKAFEQIPFTYETLCKVASSHALVADIGLSVQDLALLFRSELSEQASWAWYPQDWYSGEPFTEENDAPCWRLIRTSILEGSALKTWDEQRALIDDSMYVPSARQLVYLMILKLLAKGTYWSTSGDLRTSSISRYRSHVSVGDDQMMGIVLCSSYLEDEEREKKLGIASAIKPNR